MRTLIKRLSPTLFLIGVMSMLPAHAFMLGGTRVIIPEGNVGTIPVISGAKDGVLLVKARISRDQEGRVNAPEIMVSPPLFRLEKGGRSQLRLQMLTLAGLPRDRESIRYLNVTGIPSGNPLSPERGNVKAGMVVGQGAIIKIFFRPTGLDAPTDETWHALTATRVPGGVELSNPTPYYMSFSSLRADDKEMVARAPQTAMLPPFSRQIFGTGSVQKKVVKWALLNDLGARVSGETPIR